MVPRLCRVLPLLLALSSATACATRAVPRPFPGAPVPPGSEAGRSDPSSPDPASPSPAAHGLVATALGFRGVPYRNGGSDPAGFDCSGFVQYVFAQAGKALPRETREQFRVGRDVRPNEVQPGDLVFFETVSRGPSHVGVAIGGDEFVHAPTSRGVVRVERLTSSYWSTRLLGVRRVDLPPEGVRPD